MKVYKLTVMIIDHDNIGDGVVFELENGRFANRCIHPKVTGFESVDIGEWSDDHPLNEKESEVEFNKLFQK